MSPKTSPWAEPLILTTSTPSILLLRSSDTRPIAWCIIGFFAGIYLFVQGFRLLQRRHLILDTPVSKIRSASLGVVELSGLAVGPYTLTAPISERSCYYYRAVAWEWKRQGRSSQWVKVAAECMHVPFFLDDNTGKVMVDPRGAELDLHRDFQQEFCDSFFTTKQEAPANVHSFLLRHGVSTSNKIKIEEFCIKPKNALFLLGTLDENPGLELTPQPIHDAEVATLGAGSGLSFSLGSTLSFGSGNSFGSTSLPDLASGEGLITAPGQVIHLSSIPIPAKAADMSQQQKIAAALLKAGVSSPAAWATAGVTPSQATLNSNPNGAPHSGTPNGSVQVTSQPTTPPEEFEARPPVVLMKGTHNPTFLISWRSQRDLARSLGWKCTLMIWGGPALAVLCLYGLHSLTHWF